MLDGRFDPGLVMLLTDRDQEPARISRLRLLMSGVGCAVMISVLLLMALLQG